MNKKFFFFLIILILIFSIQLVSAAENSTDNLDKLTKSTTKNTKDIIKKEDTKTALKTKVNVKTDNVKGVIGENITLKAHVTDSDGKKVSGGNLVFKLNGKSLRTDKKFNSNLQALKLPVKNGLAEVTILADSYLRNAKNLSASYSGTSKYDEAQSPVTTAQIQKRRANIRVFSEKIVSHGHLMTISALVSDADSKYKNTNLIHENTSVLFKLNGKTLKYLDSAYTKINKDNVATIIYEIPADMGSINSKKQLRNYTITAILVGDNYYPDIQNTTTFNVKRNKVNINYNLSYSKNKYIIYGDIVEEFPHNETHNYSMKVEGTNKVGIKINGKSFVDSKTGKVKYFTVKDGDINITITVPDNIKVKRIMLVTGERQAYLDSRNEKIIKPDNPPFDEITTFNYAIDTVNKHLYASPTSEFFYINYVEEIELKYLNNGKKIIKGTFSFYDEKGLIGSKVIKDENYWYGSITIPYKFDNNDHTITIKYHDPTGQYKNQTYISKIYIINSTRNSQIAKPVKLYFKNEGEVFLTESGKDWINHTEYGDYGHSCQFTQLEDINIFMPPNYKRSLAVSSNITYSKLSITLNNNTKFYSYDKKNLDEHGNLLINLTTPSTIGMHKVKVTLYNQDKILTKRYFTLGVTNNLVEIENKSSKPLEKVPTSYTDKFVLRNIENSYFDSDYITVTFNNKTTKYARKYFYQEITLTTPSKEGKYPITITFYDKNNKRLHSEKKIVEVYKYKPKVYVELLTSLILYNYHLAGKNLTISLHDIDGDYINPYKSDLESIRVTFKNMKYNQSITAYDYRSYEIRDYHIESPKQKGKYLLTIDYLGREKYDDYTIFKSEITLL